MLEHDYEPTPGMPQALPEDERVIWQGPAQFKSLAYSTFHVRKLALYFAVLIVINLGYGLAGSSGTAETLSSAVTFTLLAALALGLLALYAHLIARTTMYTLTTRRVIIRAGVAVPVTINIPFTKIERAALRRHNDGSGEIALVPDPSSRVSYVLMWPLVKPFRPIRVQPVLRGVADADDVAELLAEQLTREAATAEKSPAAAEPPQTSTAPRARRRFWAYPTLPLAAAASLVVFSLVAVSWGQLTGPGTGSETAGPSALAAVDLYFEDKDDGSVVVIDAGNGRTLDVLEPGSNGFLRSAMRTFVNARRASDVGRDTPFLLRQMPNGQLLLSDPATDREIDLRAFGPTNAKAFGRFLSLADAQETLSNDARPSATAVALSNQEVNP